MSYENTPPPDDSTQPIPVTPVQRRPLPQVAPAVAHPVATVIDVQPAPPPKPAAFDHRFGDYSGYLLSRLGAFAVDIFAIAFIVATFAVNLTEFGPFTFASRTAGAFGGLVLMSFGAALALRFLCEAIFGTTLGKLIFNLHVRAGTGRHAGIVRAFVRNLFLPLDMLLVGPLLAAVLPRHQRLGDLFGGTVVGRSPLRALAPLVGLIIAVLVGYAQVVWGGGLTSAVGVAAEVSNFGPALLTGAQQRVAPLYGPLKAPTGEQTAQPVETPNPAGTS